MADEEPRNVTPVRIESGVASRTLAPFVMLRLGEMSVQMTPAKAREIAAMLLESAEAAEGDAFVIHFFTEELELELRQVGPLLEEFRAFRGERARLDEPGGAA